MQKITVNLSVASIDKTISYLKLYSSKLAKKADVLCEKLGEIGLNTALSIVPVATGELALDIRLARRGNANYLVVVDSEYAAFVEFGTGVVGEGTYDFELPCNWEYNTFKSPEWHDTNDPDRWFYFDEGQLFSTKGQIGSGYMGSAGVEMKRNVIKIAKEVFKRD